METCIVFLTMKEVIKKNPKNQIPEKWFVIDFIYKI